MTKPSPTNASRGFRRPTSSLAILALTLSGCAVGPNFHSPPPPQVSAYTPEALPAATAMAPDAAGGAQRFIAGQDIPGQWWTLFHSQAISDLVGQSLKANPDLAAAEAALKAAQENAYAQNSLLLPTVDANYNVTRQQASGTPAPPLTSGQNLFTLHTAQVTVGYVPDVFGGSRRQIEAAKAQAQAQRFQTEAAYLTLTSSVVAAAIQQASLRDQVAANRTIIASTRNAVAVMRKQFELGQIARADLAAQESALAQAELALPPLEKQLAQQNDLIAYLTGRSPDQTTAQASLADMTLPLDVPVSLPSKLVEQRPDVQAAEANLHAASAEVGVAIAARLPNFAISANAGGASSTLATLFSNGNGFWSVGANATQPLFEGGALFHKQKAAEAALDQAKAQYRGAVLAALQNVADTLQALQVDARLLSAAVTAESTAAESLAIAKRQLALGQVNGLTVLTAEQTYQQAVFALVQARATRYADTVALFQSLGGGWWNRPDHYVSG